MNFQATPAFLSTALAVASLVAPVSADAPARLTPEERATIQEGATKVGEAMKAAAAGTPALIESDLGRSNATNESIRKFLTDAALTAISIEDVAAPAPAPAAPAGGQIAAPGKALEVQAGPDDTVISADDGMFFDAEKGLLVYLKNVRLTGPDFDLSGANELKVFLGKKEPKKKPPVKEGEPAPEPPKEEKKEEKKDNSPGILDAASGFGDPEKIVATGAVKITQKAKDGKPPVVASAAILTYDAKTKEIILTGGYPWVQQGATFMRAMEPNLYLRIKTDGSFVTEGRWDMGGQLNPNPAAPKPAPKPANR